jgi:hypothetical protein
MKENLNGLTLKQLLRIKENQYRSANCDIDYCPKAVNAKIALITENQKLIDNRKKKKDIKKRVFNGKGKRTKSPYKKVMCQDKNCSGYAMVTVGVVTHVGLSLCPCGAGEMITNDLDLKAAIEMNLEIGF